MTISSKFRTGLNGGAPGGIAGGADPEGVSFDGTNDYLSRSSDLTGNADGKTFTFSCWVYRATTDDIYIVDSDINSGNRGFSVQLSGDSLIIQAAGTSSSNVFKASLITGAPKIPINTFTHIIVSADLTDSAKRHLYVNDNIATSVDWSVYTNANIDFTFGSMNIGRLFNNYGLSEMDGRLSNLFLDYTYRDLSVTANRRLFIDSDGKPSDTIPSSPILYLPMTDAATAGSNSGTGGDFTVNGVLDTAGRAPNQFNCSAFETDGVNDYMESTSLSMPANGKQVTVSLWYNPLETNGTIDFLDASDPTNLYTLVLRVKTNQGNAIDIVAYDGTSITTIFSGKVAFPTNIAGNSRHITISCDVSDTTKRHAVVDGVYTTATWSNYNNANIGWSTATRCIIGDDFNGGSRRKQHLGEFYLDNTYIDLSADNPFWDSDANRPKPVRQVISETGTTPLIAMPMRADDAGNNLGTAGDFTTYSGPFTGARGGSEFWARSAKFASSSNLNKWSTGGSATSRVFTMAYNLNSPTIGTSTNIEITDAVKFRQTGSSWQFWVTDNSSNNLAYITFSDSLAANTDYMVLFCFDVDNSSNNKVYINGQPMSLSQGFINAGNIDLANTIYIPQTGPTGVMISGLYFDDSYIDFSQESNRNLFVDQLGYPKDLTPAIEAGDIADPLVYLKFDDISSLGTNAGTSGNFTVTGTVTAGSDVDPNA